MAPRPAAAQPFLPDGFSDGNVEPLLDLPVGLAFLPDGSLRLLVIEQVTGKVRLLVNDVLAADDPTLVVDSLKIIYGEQGLLGVAVDPGWPQRPYLYLQYDYSGAPVIRISRYTASGDLAFAGNGSFTFDPDSRYDLLVDLPDFSLIHNGGTLRFGPDGMLYSSLGDDGGDCLAFDLTRLQGKILRLDVSQLPAGSGGPPDLALLTPSDNPFVAHPDPKARLVWAYGLRNPARFHVDPATGDLLIADVGTAYWEEVDWAHGPGMNFGWPHWEGYLRTPLVCTGVDTSNVVPPIYAFDRCDGGCEEGASIISAGLYRRPSLASHPFPPEYDGDYFFTDYYRRFLRRLKRSGDSWAIAPAVPGQPSPSDWGTLRGLITDFAVGPEGSLYYVQQYEPYPVPASGQVRRIDYIGSVDVGAVRAGGVAFPPPWPQPARDRVTLSFRLDREADCALEVFDLRGSRAAVLAPAARRAAGDHVFTWDLRDARGQRVPAGIYLARLDVEGRRVARRIVRLE
jgi:glucose/arabinose dehydrogenase